MQRSFGGQAGQMWSNFMLVLVLILVSLFSSCSQEEMISAVSDEETVQKAREYITSFQESSVAEVREQFPEHIAKSTTDEEIQKVLSRLPEGKPDQEDVIGYHSFTQDGRTRVRVSFQFTFDRTYRVVSVQLLKSENEEYKLIGFNVQKLDEDLREKHAFTFSDATVTHYCVLAGIVLIPMFIVCSLLVSVWLPTLDPSWFWILFMVVGVVRVSFNWTTGTFTFQPFYLQLLGVAFTSSGPFGPWVFHLSAPLGAVLFWIVKFDRIRAGWKGAERDVDDEVDESSIEREQDDH